MGQIQNSVNQMLGIGALIAGKARTDYNNSVMASENMDTKRREVLYNKELNNGLDKGQKKTQTELNNKFKKRFDKYAGGNTFFKNSELRRFFESQQVDKNIALDQPENSEKETPSIPIIGHKEGDDPDYDPDEEKRQAAMVEEYNNSFQQPSIQQVMAEQQMNKVDQINQFKNDTKEILNLRKDVVKNKGKYVVNMNTINGKPLNPNDTNNDIPTWKAKQVIAKQMELDSKNKKENK